jgi:hypothetical protein
MQVTLQQLAADYDVIVTTYQTLVSRLEARRAFFSHEGVIILE